MSPGPSASRASAFFLQAREGNRITSVACEKQQVSVLAEHLDRAQRGAAPRRRGGRRATGLDHRPHVDPLDAPITEEFRVGTMTIAWDPSIDRIVIELFSNVDTDEEEPAEEEPPWSRWSPTRSTPTRCSS